MASEREDLERQLLEQAQQAIRKLLDELPTASEITLSDMEQAVGVMGQAIMHQSLQRLVEAKQPPTSDAISCEVCKVCMSRRGKRTRRIVTRRGEVVVERPYYGCPSCGRGRFPPG